MVKGVNTRQGADGTSDGKITNTLIKSTMTALDKADQSLTRKTATITSKRKADNVDGEDGNANINTSSAYTSSQNSTEMGEVLRLLHNLTTDIQEIKKDDNAFKETLDGVFASNELCRTKLTQLEEENEMLKDRVS